MHLGEFLRSFTINDVIGLFTFLFVQISLASFFSLKLFGLELKLPQLLIKSFMFACVVLFVRRIYTFYQIPFGTHSIVLCALFAIFLILFFKMRIFEGLISSIICFTSYYFSDMIILLTIQFLGLNQAELFNNFIIYAFVGNMENIFLIVLILVILLTKFNFKKVTGSN